MSYVVKLTPEFVKALKPLAKKYPSMLDDVERLTEELIEDPFRDGDGLGRDFYKIRLAITSKGKGKSGGARVIACIKVINETVYLATIYDKSDKEDLSKDEFKKLVNSLKTWIA